MSQQSAALFAGIHMQAQRLAALACSAPHVHVAYRTSDPCFYILPDAVAPVTPAAALCIGQLPGNYGKLTVYTIALHAKFTSKAVCLPSSHSCKEGCLGRIFECLVAR